ncbi:hypothetical protein NKI63_30075 [Mesorhizobium sp. M0410]|uniref:hypothetical protein n=1 Tax=Mesorhizobium sp. M0410 TaxID=2956943 RepID=UPI00333BB084
MAAVAHVFTIRRVAQILGQDEDLLWDLSDRPFAEAFETSSIQLANRRQLVVPSNPARRGPYRMLT